ncbi:hypothetical protein BZA70DRAFT_86340 [Myxozyma melibiosi]|uniref:Endosomal peripheral membrane protein n=1 Tax=Myxozyma melibiosi TaxID=54550 RepID=A0ABR1EZ54_9ASCO
MGSIALLTSDLTSLLSETKRRQTELRQACEASISEIKGLSSSGKHEAEILDHLASSPSFVSPFLLACAAKNVKYSSIAIQSIQRLIATSSLNKDNLGAILAAFQDAQHLGVEVQLKILQTLPPLIEKYGVFIRGDLLARAIELCSTMQNSKIQVVVNTAAATLQQMCVAVFDEIITEDSRAADIEPEFEVPIDDGKSIVKIRPAAYDAFRVFQDICFLTEGNKPKFVKAHQISETFGLELIESIISNHATIFNNHPEQTYILRTYVFPYILRSLSERREFPIIVRVIRVLYLILRRHLPIVPVECEVALTLLIHTLDPDIGSYWKRVLVMEVFQGVFAEYALVRRFYSEYDSQEGRQPVLHRLVTAINKLSCEKPAAIGLRRLSSSFLQPGKDSYVGAPSESSVAGLFGVSGSTEVVGLSTQTSSVRVLCIDQLDKNDPPTLPDTYLYFLALNCVNSFAEGMTRFLLPLSLSDANSMTKKKSQRVTSGSGVAAPAGGAPAPAQDETQKKKRAIRYRGAPINPLTLEDHNLYPEIVVTSKIVKDCWPPLLAAYSTFLYAKLDSDLYHNLVRSFQKFTQSAGLLQLVTPRDAFLTTLGKVAVPSHIFTGNQSAVSSPSAERHNSGGLFNGLSMEALGGAGSGSSGAGGAGSGGVGGSGAGIGGNAETASAETLYGTLHVRNLLCLRALLNLAIALGPTLKSSWTIIIETLQQADMILYSAGYRYSQPPRSSTRDLSLASSNGGSSPATAAGGAAAGGHANDSPPPAGLANETGAVDNAIRKLLDCTRDFPDDAFVDLINALCKVSASTINLPRHPSQQQSQESSDSTSASTPSTPKRAPSGLPYIKPTYGDPLFALIKLGEIAEMNINRLVFSPPEASGWDAYVEYFIEVLSCRNLAPSIRMRAAEVLNTTIFSAIVEASGDNSQEDEGGLSLVQNRCLVALEEQMYSCIRQGRPASDMELTTKMAEAEIQCTTLNTLHDILDRTGSSLSNGWQIVFSVITSFFVMHHQGKLLPTTRVREGVEIPAAERHGSQTSTTATTTASSYTKAESEKITKLVKAAFGSLQLICNDFLASVPQECFIELIDLLYYFCHQPEDLNISFTTITFFWTVSDFLRTKLTDSGLNSDLSEPLKSREDLLRMAKSGNLQDSTSSLWLILLLRLTVICSDPRSEVRNGAIQILFRIFDSYGHLLGVNSWSACLWIVIYTVMEVRPPPVISPAYTADKAVMRAHEVEQKQWSETLSLILSGMSRLYSTFLYAFLRQPDFEALWRSLLKYFQGLVALRRPEVTVSVFKTLSEILTTIEENKFELSDKSVEETWSFWAGREAVIAEAESKNSGVMTQESIAAYVGSYRPLFALASMDLAKITTTLRIMRSCLLFPELPPYFSDVEYLTPLQMAIIDVVKLIDDGKAAVSNGGAGAVDAGAASAGVAGTASLVLKTYAEFSSLAFRRDVLKAIPEGRSKSAKKPAFIAVAVKCFEYVLDVFNRNVDDLQVFRDGSVAFALKTLSIPIHEKYNCPAYAGPEEGDHHLTLWMLSTRTFISIAERTVSIIEGGAADVVEESQKVEIWRQIVSGAGGIVKSNGPIMGASVKEDEQFDISAFKQLEKVIVPALGDKQVPDELVTEYIGTLYDCSFLYMLYGMHDERGKNVNERLADVLKEPLLGSTEALEVLGRQSMSYVCFESLFTLSRVETTDSPERRRLAEAAIPYLLLRCALVLHRFAADQPLRGTIPAPRLQQKELVYILSRLLELTTRRGDDTTMTEEDTKEKEEEGEGKDANYRPLMRLLPLLSKSIVASKADSDVLHLLQAAFERISTGLV